MARAGSGWGQGSLEGQQTRCALHVRPAASSAATWVHAQDMSDDEKPLGFRAGELERKHKRQAKRQATAAEVGAAPAARKPAAGAGAPQRPTPRAAPAEPARRRRREAAAGVAAAVQALAAVQAAAAADGECLAGCDRALAARTADLCTASLSTAAASYALQRAPATCPYAAHALAALSWTIVPPTPPLLCSSPAASSDDEPPSARKQRTPRRLSSGASAGARRSRRGSG